MKFEDKHIIFYEKFILQTKTLNNCRVSSNSELEDGNSDLYQNGNT